MSCIYKLNNSIEFKSELELEDYLLTHGKYHSRYGDFVFSMTNSLPEIVSKLDKIHKDTTDIYEHNRGEWVYSEDTKSREYKSPYIGVNKYLNSIVFDDGTRLFPEFTDAYWEGVKTDTGTYIGGRYSDWAEGNFTKDEITLFFDDLQDKVTAITDRQQLFRLRRLMENKWENQCLTGSAIHSIYESYFKRDESGIYRKDKLYDKNGVLNLTEFDALYNELSSESYDRKKIKAYPGEHTPPILNKAKAFTELVSKEIFKLVIDKCRQTQLYYELKFGKNCQYFPEFKLTSAANTKWTSSDKLLGIIDLLIVDELGNLHVIDYKTSPHPFTPETEEEKGFSSAKLLAYRYQLGVYGRMLQYNGFSITKSQYLVLPIQLAGFKKVNDDQFTYEGINYKGDGDDMYDDITTQLSSENNGTYNKLNIICDYEIPYSVSAPDLFKDVATLMKKWFPEYTQYSHFTEDLIIDMLKELDCFKKNQETNKYEWKPEGSKINEVVTADSEKELVDKVKKYLERQVEFRNTRMENVKKALLEGITRSTSEVDFPELSMYGETGINPQWFKLEMSRYCNSNWELCEGDTALALELFGIIMLRNRNTLQYNFVKISTQPPKIKRNLAKNVRNLAGAHLSDLFYLSKQNNLMLLACQGNIEMMETMLAINSLLKLDGIVGEIQVMDPHHGLGLSASNKELLYSFNALDDCVKLSKNNFKDGTIKLGGKLFLTQTMLHDIMKIGEDNDWDDDYHRFKNKEYRSCMTLLDDCVHLPKALLIRALEKLIATLNTKGKEADPDLLKVQTDSGTLKQKHIALYNQALLAIAELKNIDFRLLLKDHDKWLESLYILKKGLSGTYLDNPGNLSSETLNLLTKLVTEAYLNIRSDMLLPISEIRDHVEKLKKSKNFGWTTEHTIGNQADLYKNLYRDDVTTDLLFKNPWDSSSNLTTEEREFLKYAIVLINKNRGVKEEVRYTNPEEYFRVPLAKGDTSSFASKKGLFNALKDRLKGWNPTTALQRAKASTEGFFDKIDSEAEKERRNTENLFEMNNIFTRGENSLEREDLISRHGKEYFETNLETLLLKHDFAYDSKKRLDEVMPMVKAAIVHLTTLGAIQNKPFTNDLEYALEYIRNKIKNESIVDPKYEKANVMANKLKSAASKMVLALSPIQAIYQAIQGVWNDIALILRRPDGSNVFTWSNMYNAAKFVYKDLFNITNKPTVSSLLNELYGINDMDMNTYMERIKSDNHGIYNLTSFLFKFASRPDYYNRMTIFQAKMIADGCLEAHEIVDGKLVYNSKLDKRYAAFLNNPTGNSPEINKARALYYEAAKQFQAEGTLVDENGDPIDVIDMKNPPALPRAYTNLEAESMKSLSDTIYGYYSHEKKSMIQSTLLGGLFMQFKTYWSGKKNQYLASGGVKLEGEWKEYLVDGKLMFYKLDENGIPTDEMTDTNTGFPVYRWEGDWQEGILCTVWDILSDMPRKGPIKAIKDKWYCEDSKLRQAYQWNLKKLFEDLVIWLVIGCGAAGALGDWLEDEKKNADKENVLDGIRLAFCNVMIKSLKNSTLDANFIDSIGSVGYTWTPFAFEYYGREVNNIYKAVIGDTDAWDTVIKSFAATNSIKPFFDTIKPDWAYRDTTD